MSTIGRSIVIRGEIHASEDLVIEGRVEGPVWCEGHALELAAGSNVAGEVVARDVTVFGHLAGQVIGTEVVDVRPDASVTADVFADRFILNDGARFSGRAERSTKVALRVARFRLEKRAPSA